MFLNFKFKIIFWTIENVDSTTHPLAKGAPLGGPAPGGLTGGAPWVETLAKTVRPKLDLGFSYDLQLKKPGFCDASEHRARWNSTNFYVKKSPAAQKPIKSGKSLKICATEAEKHT